MKIGHFEHASQVVLAPMAGVTDQPFRNLCRHNGTYWCVSEMLTSNKQLWHTRKSQSRLSFQTEAGPRWVQIAGGDAVMLGEAASAAESLGADILDINMGCPAKKVCNKAAGSALLKDVPLVRSIFGAVRRSVSIPVTVKIRLGWSLDEINAPLIARIAEDEGLSVVTVHGRSRACKFAGSVHYDRIAEVVNSVDLPVIANGDIQSPLQAQQVLEQTGAAGVMVGRAAQGKPWLPAYIDDYLKTGLVKKNPPLGEIKLMLMTHIGKLADFYGEVAGPRIARKHVGWYLSDAFAANEQSVRLALREFNQMETETEQLQAIEVIIERLGSEGKLAA